MNVKTKYIAVAVFTLTLSASLWQNASAQEFLWNVRFDTKFDNREYDPIKKFGTSQTFFSSRLTPVIGLGFGGNHRVMLGGEFTYDMGAPLSKRPAELIMYYNYNSAKYRAIAGRFNRTMLVGRYSRAIFSGSQDFYDNLFEGVALQYVPKNGHLELVLDWDGMQAEDRRESFRILSSGSLDAGVFTGGYNLNVYHLASSANAMEGVVDHIMAYLWAGAAFERIVPWFEKLTLTAGWIQSFDRERRGDNLWRTPGGEMIDLTVQKWRVGIRNQTYLGKSQMPFYETYGSRIYRGDPLFRTDSGIYNFTQVYWRPILAEGVSLDLSLGFHYDGYRVGWQQVAWIKVVLDGGMFGSKKK